MINKLLIGLLGASVIATGGYAAASGMDDAAPARTVSLPGETTSDGTTTTDTTTGTTTTAATTTDEIAVGGAPATGVAGATGVDISGPCDEAEHAKDPRCAGGGDERSGSDDDSEDDRDDDSEDDSEEDNDDDRSGSNSGKG